MKSAVFTLAGACALLAACAAEPEAAEGDPHAGHKMGPSAKAAEEKREMAQAFADRFESPTCSDSELIGTMRRTEPDGSGEYIRSYQTSPECADQLKAAIGVQGFSGANDGSFTAETDADTTETITIRLADDGSRAGVEWEVEKK